MLIHNKEVWENAIEDFIMENEVVKCKDYFKAVPLPLIVPLGLMVVIFCAFTVFTSGSPKGMFLLLVAATILICSLGALVIVAVAFLDKITTAKLVQKKEYVYAIETCVKVLKEGSKYHIETDKNNLYYLHEETSINEKLLILKVGKRDVSIYNIKQVSPILKELMAVG